MDMGGMYKTVRKVGQAAQLEGWIRDSRRRHPNPNGFGWVSLREFNGVKLMGGVDGAPGVVVEGVRMRHPEDPVLIAVEVTFWGESEMHELLVAPDVAVVVFDVEQVDE
jgi:hypothetical protein